ncbi:hypothetical protein [Flavobacterium sp.]|uniref:hypothetical protein n=1 Tax=Flavobacterium sp. TaxID=239 RepID=UPI002632E507|nr:hypothetical protein [Flavobacterium sp.]
MKKNFESFNWMDLKRYSKIINFYLRRNSKFLMLFLISSCSVQNEINKDDYRHISKTFSAQFYDKLDTVNVQYNTSFFTRSLIKEFTNNDNVDYTKPTQIQIIDNQLYLKFSDKNSKSYVLKFFGKYSKRKFVFYTNYETITFPVVFTTKQISKYSVYLSKENEIIFKNYNVNEGMLLLFGAGTSSDKSYIFKLIK